METTAMGTKNGNNGAQMFVFLADAAADVDKKVPFLNFRSKAWQIVPAIIGSLMCLPFGIMLGWPSPTYPKLLSATSPIPITIDQSAMIAGFLMIGNILGTPFCTWSFVGTKYGIILGLFGMTVGWLLMWCASNIYFLLGSRLMVGLGHGYGVGQLKIYIRDLCEPRLSTILLSSINFYTFFGVTVAYVLGYFTDLANFSLAATTLSAAIFVLCLFVPHSPDEYLKFGKTREARTLVKYLKPATDADNELKQIELTKTNEQEDKLSFFQVLRVKCLRERFAVLGLLVFFQQFSGAPATVVYTQIIFAESGVPHPELWAIAYAILFFVSNFVGVFYSKNFNRKMCLLFSSVTVTIALAINIAVIYFDFNGKYWRYTSLIALFIFIVLHSVGLAVVPFMLTQDYFPPKARDVVSKFQIVQHSALALIITKIFQVLLDRFHLYVPFCLFICISTICSLFVLTFVPYNLPVLYDAKVTKRSSLRLP